MVSFTQIALAAPLLLGVVSAAPLPAQDIAVRAGGAVEARGFAFERRNKETAKTDEKKDEKKSEVKKEEPQSGKKEEPKTGAKSSNPDDLSNETHAVLKGKFGKFVEITESRGVARYKAKTASEAAKKATGAEKTKLETEAKELEGEAKKAEEAFNNAVKKAKATFEGFKAKHGKNAKKAKGTDSKTHEKREPGKKHHKKQGKHGKHQKEEEKPEKSEKQEEPKAERDIDVSDLELMMLARDLDYYHDIDTRDVNAEYELEVRDFDFDDEYYY